MVNILVTSAVVVAICVAIFMQPDIPINGKAVILGADGYDVKVLQSPAVKGPMLEILARVLAQSRFGPFLRRIMLNQNK